MFQVGTCLRTSQWPVMAEAQRRPATAFGRDSGRMMHVTKDEQLELAAMIKLHVRLLNLIFEHRT